MLLGTACGRKGPPLPPLVRLPAAPTDLKAERKGSTVEVQLVVPAQNTDGSRPANVERVEVYAWSGPADTPPADIVQRGSRVGAIAVKAPRDPNRTIDADDPADDLEPLMGSGLDQGATAQLQEALTEAVIAGAEPKPVTVGQIAPTGSVLATTRSYVALAITTRGRRGPTSSASVVPLGSAPVAPREPTLTYDESGVTVAWQAADAPATATESSPNTVAVSSLTYHVYDASPRSASEAPSGAPDRPDSVSAPRLTSAPEAGTMFVDRRVEWGRQRCYVVRAVRAIGGLALEGDASPSACVTPVDTFAPAPPTGLTAVASQGAISLIWNPSPEKDLRGYHVLRADTSGGVFAAITTAPIADTTYTDQVPDGRRYAYAVQAVDQAGNLGAQSAAVEEAARER